MPPRYVLRPAPIDDSVFFPPLTRAAPCFPPLQVVAGTNYFVKITTGDAEAIHARIFKPLSGDAEVHSVQTGKKAEDAIEHF